MASTLPPASTDQAGEGRAGLAHTRAPRPGRPGLLGCCPHFLRAPSRGSQISPRIAAGFPAGCSVSRPWSTPSPIGLQASEPPSGKRRARWRLRGPHPHLVVQGVEGRSEHMRSSGGPTAPPGRCLAQPRATSPSGACVLPGGPHLGEGAGWRLGAGTLQPRAQTRSSGPCLQRCTRTQAKALPGSALRHHPAGLSFLKVAVALHRPEPSLPTLEGSAGDQGLLEWVQRAPPREPRVL